MRQHGSGVGANVRRVGLFVGLVSVVVSSSVVDAGDASGQAADGSTTTTTAVVTTTTTVVVANPDASVPPATPATPGATPLINETPVPPEPPEPDPSPRIRVSLARLATIDAQRALADQQALAAAARDLEAQAQAALDGAVQVRTDAEDQLRTARARLGATAVYAYMHTPGGDVVAELQGDPTAGEQERRLFAAAVDHHKGQVADAQDGLERAGADVVAAREALDATRQATAEQDRRVVDASGVLDEAQSELRIATAAEGRPPSSTSWQLSLRGRSVFTADELVQWYEEQGHGSRASVPAAELVRLFVEHGDAEGIRGDMAFAQSIHETGWFANNDTVTANNFAGIGHCSTCAAGFPFATADVGVLAQIQLLESYAERDPVYDLPRAAPRLDGPRGCCRTWTDLGGVWATDPNYGPRILGYYDDMLEWLVVKRSAPT